MTLIELVMAVAILSPTTVPASYPIAAAQDSAYAKQISHGEVTLELSPRWEDSVLVVEMRANTHSVDLSGIDLGRQIRLVVDDTELAPVKAGSLSGHHAQTTLVFRLQTRPSAFSIRIVDVPDQALRALTWPPGGPNP